jgi:hypothetical protein
LVVTTYETERTGIGRNAWTDYRRASDEAWDLRLRLGHEVRIVLAAVGGGAIRIAREVARHRIRHLETVAINCDPSVQGFEDFDRRVYLGPDSGVETDTGGSPFVGGVLARAAEPSLQRIFHGASFVILVGSLGGGAGSGAFPYVLEVAARNAEIVSAFVIKPFRCEGDRRALADRAIGRLRLIEASMEKHERGTISLQVLDNESLVARFGHVAFTSVGRHWAGILEEHIEHSFLGPAESILEAAQATAFGPTPTLEVPPAIEIPTIEVAPEATPAPPPEVPPPMPVADSNTAELMFEVVAESRPPLPQYR